MKKYDWQTIGHPKIIKFLQKNIENDKLAHAYLFSGQGNLGKKLLADEFIASVLCNDYNRKNDFKTEVLPCRKCVFCNQLEKKIHPDVYFLRREEEKKNISVSQVREMQKILNMASFLNSYKIALIENAGELSESAQNALLKVLEEPKPKTILILLVSDYKLLLPTIVSRCQLIKFYPIGTGEIYNHLVNLGANRDQAKLFSTLSRGQVGKALEFYHNQEYFQEYLEKTTSFLNLFSLNTVARFKMLENELRSFNNNQETVDFLSAELDEWQIAVRDMISLQNKLDHLVVNLYFIDKLRALAQKYSQAKLLAILRQTKRIQNLLNYNINPRLAVENLILNF